MQLVSSHTIDCPYCGETIETVIDSSVAEQNYIEDCFVCCRPINLLITLTEEETVTVFARRLFLMLAFCKTMSVPTL